jgi:hypothetical protein
VAPAGALCCSTTAFWPSYRALDSARSRTPRPSALAICTSSCSRVLDDARPGGDNPDGCCVSCWELSYSLLLTEWQHYISYLVMT